MQFILIINIIINILNNLFLFYLNFRKSAAQWGQKWRWSQIEQKSSQTSDLSLNAIKSSDSTFLSTSTSSSSTTENSFYSKFKSFANKFTNSGNSDFETNNSTTSTSNQIQSKYLETFPISIRDTVSFEDDSEELYVAEISVEKWNYFITNYPIYIMEIEGSDPLFEQYLIQRKIELKNRVLAAHNNSKEIEKDLKSSFEASSQIAEEKRRQQHQQQSNHHHEAQHSYQLKHSTSPELLVEQESEQLGIDKNIITNEEILLLEEIDELQQQVIILFNSILFNVINFTDIFRLKILKQKYLI